MSLITAIREYILGSPLQFHHQKTILETIYAQLSNQRFFYLILIVCAISVISIIIRIIRLKKQTSILPFVVCGILIYSGFCLEKSFRVGVDMDAEVPLRNFFTTDLTKSHLNEKILYILKKKPQEMDDTNNFFKSQQNQRFLQNLKKQKEMNDEDDDKKQDDQEKQQNPKSESHVENERKNEDNFLNAGGDDDSASNIDETVKQKTRKESFNDTLEQDKFTEMLRKIMQNKEDATKKAKEFLSNLKKTKKLISEDLELFEQNFKNFLEKSQDHKELLAKADISADLYKIDLVDLKKEIESRLKIVTVLENVVKTLKQGKENVINKHKVALPPTLQFKEMNILRPDNNLMGMNYLKDNSNSLSLLYPINQYLEPSLRSMLVPEKMEKENEEDKKKEEPEENKRSIFDIEEIENLTKIQIFMIIQGIICLIIFILMICNLLNIIPVCKLLLLVVLIGNVFIGIVSMIYAEVLAKKCIVMDVPFCQKRNLFDVEEVVDILNEKQEPKTESAVLFIEQKFKENYEDLNIAVEQIQKYMEESEILLMHKIDVFGNMINKLMFIESQFEPSSKFYSPIYTMKRFLDDLKYQLSSFSIKPLFPIYRQLLESEFFFSHEKDTIKVRIENFLKLNMKRKEEKANDECKKRIKKICKARKDYEQLAFALIFFGLIFVILVCF